MGNAKQKLFRPIDQRHRREEGGLPIFLPRMTSYLPQPQPGAPS